MLNNNIIRDIIMLIQLIVGKYIDIYRPTIIYTIGNPMYTILSIIYIGAFVYMLWYSVLRKDC